jgi:heat shock protein HspQ
MVGQQIRHQNNPHRMHVWSVTTERSNVTNKITVLPVQIAQRQMWNASTVLHHLVAKGIEKPTGVYLKNAENILDAARGLTKIPLPVSIIIMLREINGLKQGKVDLGG